jgi:hypothetical protein
MSTKAEVALDRARIELGDSVQPYFWDDPELLSYLDEAQVEFCREVPIRDSRTPEICTLTYKAGATEVPYHPSIRRILNITRKDSNNVHWRIPLTTQENALALNSPARSDYGVNIDATRELTRPSDYFQVYIDYDEDYLRFSSPSSTAGTLYLQVERLPLSPITECDQLLEVRPEYIPALVAWITFRAWLKQDGETFDESASSRAFALFERHTSRAKFELHRRHSTPGQVRYGGL